MSSGFGGGPQQGGVMFQSQIPQHFSVPMDFDGSMLQQEFNKLSVSPKQPPSSPLVPQVQGGGGGSGALQGIGAEERTSASSTTASSHELLGSPQVNNMAQQGVQALSNRPRREDTRGNEREQRLDYEGSRIDYNSQGANEGYEGYEGQSETMYCDDGYDEELSYLAGQVSISGNGSPGQPMPYCY